MRTKDFVAKLEHERIVEAIAAAEKTTSGEIRVFVQRGEIADPVAAAREQFEKLGMTATGERNGVLIFVAPRSQKYAVIGDAGIHQRVEAEYWQGLVEGMRKHFRAAHFTDAVLEAIAQTGVLLSQHFPRRPGDRNELPNTVEEG
ncbi:MAG: TPM domain-containing protein [Spartobacteria bacterium]